MTWQPIETAPKDGRILAYMPNRIDGGAPYIAVIWWDDEFRTDDWDYERDELTYIGAWSAGRVGSFNYEEYAEEHPSHWMPLPAAPESAS
ncbi:MAG: DUF551 domain-containing protein [Pseudomonadota bacterium]